MSDHTRPTGRSPSAREAVTPALTSMQRAQPRLDVDTRSDIYSLGVLLYEILTGHTPFDRDQLSQAGIDEMRRIIREDEPPSPSRRVSTIDARLDNSGATAGNR